MPVVKTVKVAILNDDELRELENRVVHAERLADRAENAIGEIRATSIRGTLPSSITKKEGMSLLSRSEESKLLARERSKDKNSLSPVSTESAFKKLQDEIDAIKKTNEEISDFMSATQNSMQILTNPIGAARSQILGQLAGMGSIGFAAAGGIGVAYTIGMMAWAFHQSQYGKGQIWDTRKRVLNDVRSFVGTERETDIISGETFLFSSASITQGIPRGASNTEDLRAGARRYVLRNNGFR